VAIEASPGQIITHYSTRQLRIFEISGHDGGFDH
jgi:hypothetical protein